jgi:hypothetical protein
LRISTKGVFPIKSLMLAICQFYFAAKNGTA